MYQDVIDRVKQDLTIGMVLGRPIPANGKIRCPLPGHEDKNPSCDVDLQRNTFTCWSHPGGRAGGSVLDLLMLMNGVDFKEALRLGANMLNIPLKPPTQEEVAAQEARHKREETLSALTRATHGWLMGDTDPARQARAYLEARGFSQDLMREHQLGLINLEGLYRILAKHPVLATYSQTDFEAAGLRAARGGFLFHDTRILFPLLSRGRTVGMSFRALPDSSDKRKFVHLAGLAAGLWNEDALRHPDRSVVLAEGIPDALQVAAFGIPAVGNLGLETAKNAHRFAHLKRVTLAWDNDSAGRGRALKSAMAIQAVMKDGDVHVLHMPGAKDINDWARAGGTKEEFLDLLRQAPDLLDMLIARLPKEAECLKESDLEPVFDVIRMRSSLGHKALLKRVTKHVPTPLAELQSRLAASSSSGSSPQNRTTPTGSGPDAAGSTSPGTKVPLVRQILQPGLCLWHDGDVPTWRMGVHIQRTEPMSASDGTPVHVVNKELIIVQNLPDGLNVSTEPYSLFAQDEEEYKRFPGRKYPVWDQESAFAHNMFLFLDNQCPPVSGCHLFDEVKRLLTRFLWFPDPRDLDLLATWILMTYVFPAFNAVPYLHFHGSKASGKTTALSFVSRLAFNAMKCAGPTEAAASMHVANTSGTLIIDEAERLLNPRPGSREEFLMLILLIGYQAGAILPKGDAESQQPVERCVFGPKCLGSIGRIQHVLRSRCLAIHTKEADADHLPEGDMNHDAREAAITSRVLRNQLHVWSLRNGLALHERVTHDMRNVDRRRLGSRDRELWLPPLTIARHLDVERGEGSILEATLMELRQVKEVEHKALEAE
ncbi:MAG: toprim domain-containing protein [bacterium]|nr:toprim domain-containing protein [bacterium]